MKMSVLKIMVMMMIIFYIEIKFYYRITDALYTIIKRSIFFIANKNVIWFMDRDK